MNIMQELTQLKHPHFHLVISENSDFQKFFFENEIAKSEGIVIKQIEGCRCTTLDKLFAEFAMALEFPDYFGANWAAFDECINDLDWLSGKAYLLLIVDAEQIKISDTQFKILVETLENSINEWVGGRNYDDFPTPPTPFHIVFQCSIKKANELKERFKMAGLLNINTLSLTE